MGPVRTRKVHTRRACRSEALLVDASISVANILEGQNVTLHANTEVVAANVIKAKVITFVRLEDNMPSEENICIDGEGRRSDET